MNQHRFLNPTQPQTLVNATIICYIEAVFALISGYAPFVIVAVGLGAGGYGIANEKKWGYGIAVGGAVLQVAIWLRIYGVDVVGFPQIISVAFAVMLVVLLVHPMSREYQRIWFR